MVRPLAAIRREALASLRSARDAPHESRAPYLRRMAELVVELREHFMNAEGEPDWRGSSYAYRQSVADLWSEAGITGDERATMNGALRYHVGAALRDRLDEAELEALNLRAESPRERSRQQREVRAAVTLLATEGAGLRGVDVVKAVTGARALLERVDTEALASLSAADRKALSRELAKIRRRCETLAK